jgi:chaperone required for assembly of F1-ATPase
VRGLWRHLRAHARGTGFRELLYPGVEETLRTLAGRDGIVLGIATGKSRRGVAHVLARHGWVGLFATVQTADDAPSKPHPGMLERAMRETGAAPDSTLMVGDSSYDMAMARAAAASRSACRGASSRRNAWSRRVRSASSSAWTRCSDLPTYRDAEGAVRRPVGEIMSDLFDAPYQPADPTRSARGLTRPELPKRIYVEVSVGETDGAFSVLLDGRELRTPARTRLLLPSPALAQAVAGEWAAQGANVDPATMPLTRLVNSALDGVAREAEGVRADIVRYAGSDLVCYRAGEPQRLVQAQAAHWDPVVAWAGEALGARLHLAEGVMFIAQPEAALERVRAAVAAVPEPLGLAGLHVATTLTGSALIALALARGRLTREEAWAAAHVDEDVQMAIWGEDEEAMERRARRRADFDAAATLLTPLA